MKIDRVAFLAMTTALACTTGPSASAPHEVEIPHQPPPAASPVAIADASPPREEPPKVADAAPEEPVDDPDDEPTRTSGCGFVDPATVTRPTGTCSDDKGTVGACTAIKSCRGVAFPQGKCEAYKKYFKPRVAQRAVECLSNLGAKDVCDACNAYRCGETAIKTACDDASAVTTCAQVTAKCKAISMADCRSYLSGMNAAGRAKMAFCLSQPVGCGFGIFSCAEGLF